MKIKNYPIKHRPKLLNSNFRKYLKSIGLENIYKYCSPPQDENLEKNYNNNRYKYNNKVVNNNLPNIFIVNNKKSEKDYSQVNKIIPNRRLVPLLRK